MGKHGKSKIICGTWSPASCENRPGLKVRKKSGIQEMLVTGGGDNIVTISNQNGEPAFDSQSKCVITIGEAPTKIMIDPYNFEISPDGRLSHLSIIIVINYEDHSTIRVAERSGKEPNPENDRECTFDAQYGKIKRCLIIPASEIGGNGGAAKGIALIILFSLGSLIQLTLYKDGASKNTFNILPICQEVNDIAHRDLDKDQVLICLVTRRNRVRILICAPTLLAKFLRDKGGISESERSLGYFEEFKIHIDQKGEEKLKGPEIGENEKKRKLAFHDIVISPDATMVYVSSNQVLYIVVW